MIIKKINYGLSLLELTLAISLSALVFTACLKLYLVEKNLFHEQIELASLQNNLRFAQALLSRNIKETGFIGCPALAYLKELPSGALVDNKLTFANSLLGINSANAPSYIINKIKPYSDGIIIKKGNSVNSVKLLSDVTKGTTYIRVKSNPASAANKLLVLSDCTRAELLATKNFTGNVVEFVSPVQNSYRAQSGMLMSFSEVAYFIAYTGRKDLHGKKQYGLYMVVNKGSKQELLDGIDDMHILYGVAKSGQKNVYKYYRAQEITNPKTWQRVKSVRITLHFVGVKKNGVDANIYIALRERE